MPEAEFLKLLCPEIQSFIRQNEKADVAKLALKKPPNSDWPYRLILEQIKARQKAAVKLPHWLAYDDIILPAPDLIEQASSQITADYKASLVSGEIFADLTGGAGIDSAALAGSFEKGFCVEMNSDSAERLAHNFMVMGLGNIEVCNKPAEDFIKTMPKVDLVYIDPQRRTSSKKGRFLIESGSPNVLDLIEDLKKKTQKALIKTSPMLDISAAIEKLDYVHEVHVIGVQNECREVLYLLDFSEKPPAEKIPVNVAELSQQGKPVHTMRFTRAEEKGAVPSYSEPLKYLYDPYSVYMKAGCFNLMADCHDVLKLHPNTHLYTSKNLEVNFPGRKFEIIDIYHPKEFKKFPSKANLSIRGYPAEIKALEKKFGIKNGGEDYLFACLNTKGDKLVIHCKKALI